MTKTKRIILNIIATYGRSLFSTICGLFTARWVLEALGQEAFGLYGVVGGLTVFISFLNHLIGTANVRFYAIAIGEAEVNQSRIEGLEKCRKWFNTSLMLHIAVPVIMVLIGWPIGEYAVREWLTIPPVRLNDCIWVFRLACITCFLAMIEVPFSAMYRAKQYIAELTIYGVFQTVINFLFFYYMATHSGEWLVKYAIWMCATTSIFHLVIICRALCVFDECKIKPSYWGDWKRVGEMSSYAGWNAVAAIGGIFRGQGIAILINKFFGAGVNASMTIANQVNGQAQTFAAAMQGAFSPVIISAYGAGDRKLFESLSFRACKFGMVLLLIFIVPLAIELPTVMRLWLVNPPKYSVELCFCMMLSALVDKSTIGHMIAVNAKGKIALYQSFLGGLLILTLPVAWIFVKCGFGVYGVGIAWALMQAISALGRTIFAYFLVGFSIRFWFTKIFLPVLIISLISAVAGFSIWLYCEPGIMRLVYTILICEIVFLPLIWIFVFDDGERKFVKDKVALVLKKKT